VQGYDIFSKFLPQITKWLTNQVQFAFRMTNNKFGDKTQLDTSDFRNAIVYYLKEIHGLRDETFKYKKINDLFSKEQKVYIKKVMCSPGEVLMTDYAGFSDNLDDSEKCHVCILAMETKK